MNNSNLSFGTKALLLLLVYCLVHFEPRIQPKEKQKEQKSMIENKELSPGAPDAD